MGRRCLFARSRAVIWWSCSGLPRADLLAIASIRPAHWAVDSPACMERRLNCGRQQQCHSILVWVTDLRDFIHSAASASSSASSSPCAFFSWRILTFVHARVVHREDGRCTNACSPSDGSIASIKTTRRRHPFAGTITTATAIRPLHAFLQTIKQRYSVKRFGTPQNVLGQSIERYTTATSSSSRNEHTRVLTRPPKVTGAALNSNSSGDKLIYAEMQGTPPFLRQHAPRNCLAPYPWRDFSCKTRQGPLFGVQHYT